MAKSWQYGRLRRILMQGVMWLIFAGTVALAALVTRNRNHSAHAELAQVREVGPLTVRVPAKWGVVTDVEPGTLLVAREPGTGSTGGRTLTIRRLRAKGATSPQEFLAQSGLLRGAITIEDDGDSEDVQPQPATVDSAMKPLKIGGWPGVMATLYRPVPSPMGIGEGEMRREVLACALLPSRVAIVLRLDSNAGFGEGLTENSGDAELVQQVAESIRIIGEQPPQKQTAISLVNGLTLKVPDPWVVLSQADLNRTDRAMLLDRDGDGGGRLLIEIVPCVALPSDLPENARTLLLLHHPLLSGAKISRDDGSDLWRFAWPSGDDTKRLTGARLITRTDGNSVLLIFGGAAPDSAEFTNAAQVLAGDISITDGFPAYTALLTAGADEARRLGGVGLSGLIGEGPIDQWTVMRDTTSGSAVGWSHVRRDTTAEWGMSRETRYRADKHATEIIEHWNGDGAMATYHYDMTRRDADGVPGEVDLDTDGSPSAAGRYQITSEQSTLLHGGTLAMHTKTAGAELLPPAAPTPQAFVPGGWLATFIGKLSPTPMILQTESPVGLSAQGIAVTQPLRLVITPTGPAKLSDGGKTPLRCITVEVSGTGELNRFYFKSDGTLDSVDYPDDLQQTPAEEQTVKFQFHGDARMEP